MNVTRYFINISEGNAQRFALPACGRSVDPAWEQEKLEARKILLEAADSHTSGARIVRPHDWQIKLTN